MAAEAIPAADLDDAEEVAGPMHDECTVSSECPDDYGRACWKPLCAVGECRMAKLPLGRECDDGDPTTGWDMCTAHGWCVGIPLALATDGAGGSMD